MSARYGWALDHHVKDEVERQLVQGAEKGGLGSVWTMENHHLRDGVTTAAVTLERTKSIPVVMGCLSPYFRHPIEIGLTLATLERMYPERTGLNLGAGMQETLRRIGIEDVDRPVGQLREAVEVIRLLLEGERFEFQGERFQIERHHLTGEKLRVPPIYFSVMGPLLIRLAGEVADGVNLPLASSPEYTAESAERFRIGSERGERDRSKQKVVAEVLVEVTEGGDDKVEGVRRLLGFHFASEYFKKVAAPSGMEIKHDEIRDAFVARDMDRVFSLIDDETVSTFSAVGTPAEIIKRLGDYKDAGAEMILLYTAGDEEARLRTMEKLTEALREAGELEEKA